MSSGTAVAEGCATLRKRERMNQRFERNRIGHEQRVH